MTTNKQAQKQDEERVVVRGYSVYPWQIRRLMEEARRRDRSVSYILREAIVEYLSGSQERSD